MVSGVFTAGGAFSLFALGMGGKSGVLYGSAILIGVLIITTLSCLITPVSGLWGIGLVAISTVKEINQDRKPQELNEPYRFHWTRVLQSGTIGFALYLFFNVASARPMSNVDGSLAFATFLTGTALFPLLILPTLTMLGSLIGGLGHARFRGRESATALGAVVGGIAAASIAFMGFIIYLIIR